MAARQRWNAFRVIGLATLIVSANINAPVAFALETPLSIALAPLRSDYDDSDKIGVIKAGLICLPAGIVRAGNFLPAFEEGLRRRLQRRSDSGVYGTSRYGDLGLDAKVSGVNATLCASHWGLGDRTSYKGSVEATVLWTPTWAGEPSGTSYTTTASFRSQGKKRYSLSGFANELSILLVDDLNRQLIPAVGPESEFEQQ